MRLNANSCIQTTDKSCVKTANVQTALNFVPVIILEIASTENHQFRCSSRAAEPCLAYKKIQNICLFMGLFIHSEQGWVWPLTSSTLCLQEGIYHFLRVQ